LLGVSKVEKEEIDGRGEGAVLRVGKNVRTQSAREGPERIKILGMRHDAQERVLGQQEGEIFSAKKRGGGGLLEEKNKGS